LFLCRCVCVCLYVWECVCVRGYYIYVTALHWNLGFSEVDSAAVTQSQNLPSNPESCSRLGVGHKSGDWGGDDKINKPHIEGELLIRTDVITVWLCVRVCVCVCSCVCVCVRVCVCVCVCKREDKCLR